MLLLLLNVTAANSQCTNCLTNVLHLGTGYDHENAAFYPNGTNDQYWMITNGPSSYSYPRCAVSNGDGLGHKIWPAKLNSTGIHLLPGTSLDADGNTECGNNCTPDGTPYRFERRFCVNTQAFVSASNPTGARVGNMVIQFCGDLNVLSAALTSPSGAVLALSAGCINHANCFDSDHFLNYAGTFETGVYTLTVQLLNDWSCSGPFWNVTKSPTGMVLEVFGSVGSSDNIFTDNAHYGKNTLCAPAYPPSPDFTISGNGICVIPPATSPFTINPFYNSPGQNVYLVIGPGSPAISSSGIFNAGIGTYTVTSTDAKGCSKTKTITVLGKPTLSITPSSQCITPVSTTILTASVITGVSPYTYSINGGTFSSSSVFNVSQGFYTITVKDATGCTGTSVAKVGNTFAGVLESNGNHCHPDVLVGSTYPAITPMYYSFNGSPSSIANTFTTTSAGIYTVIATDAYGCTASSNISVFPRPTVTASSSFCSAPSPGSYTITANGSGIPGTYNYQLNNGPGQSSNSFTVPLSGTYTVIVTASNGCSSFTTVTTPPMDVSCCNPSLIATSGAVYYNGLTIPVSSTSFPLLGGGEYGFQNVNTNIIIDGTVEVNTGTILKFDGCPNVFMGPNARIVVKDFGTLIIQNSILKAACNQKWQGIFADNATKTVKMLKTSEIHDMYNGVEISGPSSGQAALLECEGVSFIDCDYGIVFTNTKSGYLGIVRSCVFESTSNMLGPILRTKRGVSIFDCEELEIGGLYPPTNILGNKFKNLDNGIYVSANVPTTAPVLNSNIRLFNNSFVQITGGKQVNDAFQTPTNGIYLSELGCAIYAKNYSPYYPQANIDLTIDHYAPPPLYTPPPAPYYYSYCDKGIITSNVSVNLSNARMYFTSAGCLNTFTDGRTFNIRDNYISFAINAISIIGYNKNLGKISNNEIVFGSPLQPLIGMPTRFYNPVGITLQRITTSPITSSTYYFHINSNKIDFWVESGTGIEVLNGGSEKIFDNAINYKSNNSNPVPFTNTPEFKGIELTNSTYCRLRFNKIIGNNVTRNFYDKNVGIRVNKSNLNDYYCNEIYNTKYGFLITSNCNTFSTSVIGNKFENHIFAMLFLHLGSEGTLGAKIGEPPVGSTPGLEPYNRFGVTPYPLGYKLYKNSVCSGTPALERLFTQSYILNNLESGGNNFNCRYDVVNLFNPFTVPNCGTLPHFLLAPPISTDSISDLIAIATGSVVYPEFEEGTRWMNEQSLYERLAMDAMLRYSHPALDSFYDDRQTSVSENIFQTDVALQMMLDSLSILDPFLFNQHLQSAITENNGIVSADQEALNVRLINTIYFKIIQNGLEAITNEDDSLIQAFALSCPFITGIAAYKARAMYALYNSSMQYDDLEICNAVGVYKNGSFLNSQLHFLDELNNTATAKTVLGEGIQLFPNPASDYVTIAYQLNEGQKSTLILYDMVGKECNRVYLNDQSNKVQFSVSNLPSGVYAYKYLVDDIPFNSGKLIINK